MNSYATRAAARSLEINISNARLYSALRRGAIVFVTLVIATWALGPAAGAAAASASLLVGLNDKAESARTTALAMSAATVVLTAAQILASLVSPWPLASTLVIIGFAFAAGVTSGVKPRATGIVLFGAVMAASAALNPVPADQIPATAAMVLAAGLAQAAAAAASARIVRELPECRPLSHALRAIADHLDSAADHSGDALSAAYASSAAIAAADDVVRKSDLSADQRERYARLLADADAVRLEAAGLRSRERLGLPIPDDDLTSEIVHAAATLLRSAAAVLMTMRRRLPPAVAKLDAAAADLDVLLAAPGLTRTARALGTAAAELARHVHDVIGHPSESRGWRSPERSLVERISVAIRPSSLPFRLGVRMATAAVIGELATRALGLDHGSWTAVTAMLLLRPEVEATISRTMLRALGTVIGTTLIVALAWLAGPHVMILVLFVGLLATLTYSIAAVHYAAFVACMATTIVLILTLAGRNPYELALARLSDVLIGCVIGLALAYVFPLWVGRRLGGDIAGYANAVASWLDSLAGAAADPDQADLEQVRTRAKTARRAAHTARGTLSNALMEPDPPGISAQRAAVVIAWIHRSAQAAMAAEVLLRHGAHPEPAGPAFARIAATDLRITAALVAQTEPSSAVPLPESAPVPDDDRLDRPGQLLFRAARAAQAALRAAIRPNPPARPGIGRAGQATGSA